jgi:hypothetical protein
MRRPVVTVLAFLLLVIAGARQAHAAQGTWFPLDDKNGWPMSSRVRAWVRATDVRSSRPGAYGYVTVRLQNPGSSEHTARVMLVRRHTDSDGRITRTVKMPAGGDLTIHLPLPAQSYPGEWDAAFALDDQRTRYMSGNLWSAMHGDGLSTLHIVDSSEATQVQQMRSIQNTIGRYTSRGVASDFLARRPTELPDSWVMLSGFDLIMVNGLLPDLDPEHERMLQKYVAGGGHLIVLNVPKEGSRFGKMLTGDLSHRSGALANGEARTGCLGLGWWCALAPDASLDQPGLAAWRASRFLELGFYEDTRLFSGGLPSAMWFALDIPGLGEVPVRTFFFLILVFAIAVGPVSYVALRRRRKLAWLLVTIPAGGFACAAAILLYGFLSEGFGIRGSVRSFTVLDQRSHQAATCAGRTLYAGLQPGALRPDPETFFSSRNLMLQDNNGPSGGNLYHDLDTGRIEGSALPSRTPTTFTTATVGRARERLRFKRREDGGLDVLAGVDFVPVAGRGTILLRTPDGRYFAREASGTLRPIESTSSRWRDSVVAPVAEMPMLRVQGDRFGNSRRVYHSGSYGRLDESNDGEMGFVAWLKTRLDPDLEPGTYLARMEQAPGLDDLDLDVNYEDARHLVLGILAEDDILE